MCSSDLALANIGLPLTNGFIGEFLMLNGVFASSLTQYYIVFTALAGVTIILAAVYMLNAVRKVFYGNTNSITEAGYKLRMNETLTLGVIVVIIFSVGIFPGRLLEVSADTSQFVLTTVERALQTIMKR